MPEFTYWHADNPIAESPWKKYWIKKKVNYTVLIQINRERYALYEFYVCRSVDNPGLRWQCQCQYGYPCSTSSECIRPKASLGGFGKDNWLTGQETFFHGAILQRRSFSAKISPASTDAITP